MSSCKYIKKNGQKCKNQIKEGCKKYCYKHTSSESYSPDNNCIFPKFKDIPIVDMEKVALGQKLSEGTYGVVYLATYGKERLVVKKTKYTPYTDENESLIKSTMKEIVFLQILDSPYIVKIKYIILDDHNRPHVALEKLDGDVKKLKLDEETTKEFLNQMLQALEILYYHSIIHADLKPANILRKKNHYYVSDLGLSILLPSRIHQITGQPSGTPVYLPDYHKLDFYYDRNIDVFSLAITTIHLLTSYKFIFKDNLGCISDRCKRRIRMELGYHGYDLLVNKMLGHGNKTDGKSRPISACEALKHPFLTGAEKYTSPSSCISLEDSLYKEYYNICIDTTKTISKGIWDILVEWMADVCLDYDFHINTFTLSIILLLSSLRSVYLDKKTLQAYAMCCIKIADNFFGIGNFRFDIMNEVSAHTYETESNLESYYLELLKAIHYKIPLIPLFIFIEKSSLDIYNEAIMAKTYLIYELCKYNTDTHLSVRKTSEFIIQQFKDPLRGNEITKYIYNYRETHLKVFKKLWQKFENK